MRTLWVGSRTLLLVFLGLLNLECRAEALKIFGDENYSEVIYLAPQGQARGLLPELLTYYAKASGTPIEVQLSPWKLAYSSALAGRGGVIGLSRNREREALFDYSEPVYYDDIGIVVLQGREFAFDELEDLRGKKIGAQLGASFGAEVDQAIDEGVITLERDQRHVARLKKLLHGRIDAAFIGNGRDGLNWLITSDEQLQTQRHRFVLLPRPLTRDPLYLGFAKAMGKRALLDEFNRVLREGRSRGELPRLEQLVP
ncbi:MAG TPA: transporter substrate-binding domain-containing protein [Pseudomonas sp.]|nr:transporter substrate-binding domain-containing protein [Pseudomonas sp.]